MLQSTEAESRQEAARPHFCRALETTLDIQRERLLASLSRANTNEDRERARDVIRDAARFITNGLQPLLDHVEAEGIDGKLKWRVRHIAEALYDAAHPQSPLPRSPLPPEEADIARAIVTLASKIDALAIGVELLLRKGGN